MTRGETAHLLGTAVARGDSSGATTPPQVVGRAEADEQHGLGGRGRGAGRERRTARSEGGNRKDEEGCAHENGMHTCGRST